MSIEIQQLTYTYMKGTPFEKAALKDINLNICKGEFVGIIGHTGSGKSTLIQHFNGLLKPSTGKVLVNGIDTAGKGLKGLRQQVGIIFQYPEHQLFEETVLKDICFGLLKQGLDEKQVDERVKESIKAVGLDDEILNKSPFELSGGQKRRVAIAGVLAMKPDIIVLDEPTAGLDPGGRNEIFSFISQLHKKQGITIILVSHSMEDVAKYVNRVIVLNRGMIEMDGTPGEVFLNADRLVEIGLSAPQITYLMKRLKSIVPDINDSIYSLEQAKREILRVLKR